MSDRQKILILFGMTKLEDMLQKGNVWYVRHYEAYFDKVYVVYLNGKHSEPIISGNTTLISLGSGNGFLNGLLNLFLSPLRLYRFAKSVNATHYLTADLVFSWWTSWLIKLLLRAKIVLMPVCMPEIIYKNTGKSLSGLLPINIERLLIANSFACADRILTGYSFGNFVNWLSNMKSIKNKLVIVDTLVEALTADDFMINLEKLNKDYLQVSHQEFTLVYVGRLHREKMVGDLIKMMEVIQKMDESSKNIVLNLIGDGPQRVELEKMAFDLGVSNQVRFIGYVLNSELPKYLLNSDIFVSTLTGTSLREAALCGLPIVAYNHDWVVGLLQHEINALLVNVGEYEAMAKQVLHLYTDVKLQKSLSENIKSLANKLWTTTNLKESLKKAFNS